MANSELSGAPATTAALPEEASAPVHRGLEQLRELAAHYPHSGEDAGGAGLPVRRLLEDAEQIVYEILEEAARLRQDALSEAEQLRVRCAQEGASLVDEARATANRIRTAGERDRANLLEQAHIEADDLRMKAETHSTELVRVAGQQAQNLAAEAQGDRAALLQGARAEAQRLHAEAQDDRAALLDAAHAEAERLRAEGRAERAALLGAAQAAADRLRQQAEEEADALLATSRAEADEVRAAADADAQQAAAGPETSTTTRPPVTPMHSSEISARQFPRGWRGLDPAPVQKWLSLVESSQATLEDEVDRLQASWDDAVDCLTTLKMRLAALETTPGLGSDRQLEHARDDWEQAARALAAGSRVRASRSTFESLLVRQAMLEAPIRRQLLGYSRAEVDRLLASSAAQVARLENRAAIVAAENQQLRDRLLAQASWRLPVQAGEASLEHDRMRSLPQRAELASVGSGDEASRRH